MSIRRRPINGFHERLEERDSDRPVEDEQFALACGTDNFSNTLIPGAIQVKSPTRYLYYIR